MPRTDGPWNTVWMTDGDKLNKAGRAYSLADARVAITADLADASKNFPFRVEGHVFHQVIEQTGSHYVIALVDSGWLDPADREVKLTAQLPGDWSILDRLTGRTIGPMRNGVSITVPAGALRLLEVRDATKSPHR